MASSLVSSSPLLSSLLPSTHCREPNQNFFLCRRQQQQQQRRLSSLRIRAAKAPDGVIVPKVEPKLKPAFLGFTKTAEIWNSRACMIGLIGTFIVELILNKGILQVIGVDVGKGLDLPL